MIDQSGLSDSTNATIKICAFNSKVRMFPSLRAIACLKNSRRSSWVGTSDVIADCSSLAQLSASAAPSILRQIFFRRLAAASECRHGLGRIHTPATSLEALIMMTGTEYQKERSCAAMVGVKGERTRTACLSGSAQGGRLG